MLDITIKDNYFPDVEHVRELGIRTRQWRISDKPDSGPGWRGIRSEKFKKIGYGSNEELLQIEKDIFNFVWEERNLKDWKYPSYEDEYIGKELSEVYGEETLVANRPMVDPMITTYFHRSPANTVDMLNDFYTDRFHRDSLSCAGVIFLNPDPPPNTGTSILDSRNTLFTNVENVYNRLIAYDGYNIHALTGCFGNSPKTDRLTIVFFVHEKALARGFI